MATNTTTPNAAPLSGSTMRRRTLWGDAWRRLIDSTAGRLGLGISLFLIVLAIFVPIVMPYDPGRDRNLRLRLVEPSWAMTAEDRTDDELGLWSLPFGADELGRDLFIRVLHGAPISLSAGFAAVSISVLVGSLLGLLAGFIGGWVDTVAVWIMDILLAFPSILLAIVIVTILGPGLFNALLAVSIVEIPVFGRIARSTVLSIRSQEYITSARAVGVPGPRILFRHVLPNSLSPMLVQATLSIATAIINIAALGFLGLGAEPPTPEWGTMLESGRDYVGQGKWWYTTFPGLSIMLTVLGFNLLGDGLRDALDPRLQRSR
ncbi:MAG: ABC transporter permease [Chloroflexaceae bacterium]|nr:ABC transporter permease [Chloroflexaceae bacterium]NJO08121.1 ABC transporter permease [Chloroflexaceae bacterium]